MSVKLVLVLAVVTATLAEGSAPSATDLWDDIYSGCLQDFSISCVKPKILAWMSLVVRQPEIKVTEDLVIVKKDAPKDEEQRGQSEDIFDKFEDFLQTHDVVARVPDALRPTGLLGDLVPRNLQPEDVKIPLAATGTH